LRKLAWFVPVIGLLFFAQLASAQQGDAMFGFGTLMSSGSCDPNTGLCPEKGGLYASFSADVIFHKRVGFNFETAWRASQGSYGGPGGQPFRPILSDFNLMYQPKLNKKVGADLLAGVGWQSTRFYLPYCTNGFTCNNFVSSRHFLVDLGAGVRYYVWNHVFVRPEVHYYRIFNNTDVFSNDNVFRVGASIGYTIGPD
jgi:Outer membrane protein beta-barrel domain